MTKEQEIAKKALQDEIMILVKELVTDSQKDNAKSKDVELIEKKLNDKIKGLDNSGTDELAKSLDEMTTKLEAMEKTSDEQKEIIEKQGLSITSLKEGGETKDSPMTFRKALEASVNANDSVKDILTEKNDDLGKRMSMKDYFTTKGHEYTPVFEFKTAVDMFNTNIAGNYVNLVRLTESDPQTVSIPLGIYQHVTDYMPLRFINKPSLSLLVAWTYVDGSGTTTEGGTPGQSSILFKTIEFKAQKIDAYATLGEETLDDFEQALDELATVMPDKIQDKIDGYVLGTTGDDSTAIKGMRTTGSTGKSTAFVPATYEDKVVGANVIDLVGKMKLSCLTNKYKPDTVWMNPSDIDDLSALKDQLDNSISDRRVRFDTMGNPVNIAGCIIKATTDMPADQCVVGMNVKNQLGVRKNMEFQIGLSGDNFRDGERTARISIRIAYAVRDKAAFIWSNGIAAAIATITNTPA